MNDETIPEDIKKAAVTAHAGWVANLKAAYLPTVREQEFFFLRHVEAAILAERKRCLDLANGWLIAFGETGAQLKFTTPQQYANDAMSDLADLINSGASAPCPPKNKSC